MDTRRLATIGLAILVLAGAALIVLGLQEGGEQPRRDEGSPPASTQEGPSIELASPADGTAKVQAHDSRFFAVHVNTTTAPIRTVNWSQGDLSLLVDRCDGDCESIRSELVRTFKSAGDHELVVEAVDEAGRTATLRFEVHVEPSSQGSCSSPHPCRWILQPPADRNQSGGEVQVEVEEDEMFELGTVAEPQGNASEEIEKVRWLGPNDEPLRNETCRADCGESQRFDLLWSFEDPGQYTIKTVAIAGGDAQDTLTWNITVTDI